MIVSMTGFGRSTRPVRKMNVAIELRSVNSKYFEVSSKLPMFIADKENEIKELVGRRISRGKVNVNINIERNGEGLVDIRARPDTIKEYLKLLNQVRKTAGIKEEVRLEHLLKFSEIFKVDGTEELKKYWDDIKSSFLKALDMLCRMKQSEGKVIARDMNRRLSSLRKSLNRVERYSTENINENKAKLREKIKALLDPGIQVDRSRLEFEIVMISDKMDVTEEVVRTKSHLDYFKKNMSGKELSGRKLTFLVQEIGREINTISSKSSSSRISQNIVEMKEELEKIREQLQNVE